MTADQNTNVGKAGFYDVDSFSSLSSVVSTSKGNWLVVGAVGAGKIILSRFR